MIESSFFFINDNLLHLISFAQKKLNCPVKETNEFMEILHIMFYKNIQFSSSKKFMDMMLFSVENVI